MGVICTGAMTPGSVGQHLALIKQTMSIPIRSQPSDFRAKRISQESRSL